MDTTSPAGRTCLTAYPKYNCYCPPPPDRMAQPPCKQSEHGSEHHGNCKWTRLDMQTPWPSSLRLLVPRLQGAKALHGSRPTSTKLLAPAPGPGTTAAPPTSCKRTPQRGRTHFSSRKTGAHPGTSMLQSSGIGPGNICCRGKNPSSQIAPRDDLQHLLASCEVDCRTRYAEPTLPTCRSLS